VYVGPVAEGEALLRPLREYGPPIVDLFQPMPFNQAQRMADFVFPPGHHGYWKSGYLSELSDGAIDVMTDFFSRVPSKQTAIVVEHNGHGAMERIPDEATAFGHRRWPYNFVVTAAWKDADETDRNIQWTRGLFEAMQPYLANGVYVNYMAGDEGLDRLRAAYGTEKLARLAALKMKYDPENLFRMNQNIVPEAALRNPI
jgi:hypothetical protein